MLRSCSLDLTTPQPGMSIFADGETEAQRSDLGGHTGSGGAGIVTCICHVTKDLVLSRAQHPPRVPFLRQCPNAFPAIKRG